MVTVRNNMHYRRNTISTSGAVKLSALYKDLPLSETPQWTLAGSANANRFVIEGKIPSNPNYGGGKLENMWLMTAVTGTDVSESSMFPTVSTYKINRDVTMVDGTGSQLSAADSLMVVTRHMDKSMAWVEEGFDGAETSIGEVTVTGAPGGGTLLGENPYVDAEAASNKVYLGGDFSFFHIGEDVEGGSAEFLKMYFGRTEGGAMGTIKERKIYVKPHNRKKPRGLWTTRYDNRTGLNKYTVFKPLWKFNSLKSLLYFERGEKAAPATETEAQPVSKNNTIFQIARMSPSISNAWEGNPAGAGWCQSWLELSSTEYESGGQSLHMAHFWDRADGMADTNRVYGPSGTLNPQYAMVTTDLGPIPTHMDQAGASRLVGLTEESGNQTVTAPEINIKFKITKMAPALIVSGGTNATRFELPVARTDGAGETTLSAATEASTPGSPVTLSVASNTGWAAGGGVGQIEGDGFYYTGTGTNTITGVANLDHSHSSGETVSAETPPTYKVEDADFSATSLLRSFSVTFGNAPPKEGDNLDTYLYRAMVGAYNGVSSDYMLKGGVIGGMTVIRYQGVEGKNPSILVAAPLLTEQGWYNYSEHTAAAGGVNNTSDVFNKSQVGFFLSGASAAVGYKNTQLACMPYELEPGEKSWAANRTGATNDIEPSIALGMDEWVNMKFVWSPNLREFRSIAGTGSAANTAQAAVMQVSGTGYSEGGPACRVHFTEGVHQITGNAAGGAGTNEAEDKPPSFNLVWPVSEGKLAGSGDSGKGVTITSIKETGGFDNTHANFESEWPRYMTIWLQNFRFVDTGGADDKNWGQNSDSNSVLTGEWLTGSKECEVFVDSITFKGVNGQLSNCSAGASSFTKPISIKQHPQQLYLSTPDQGPAKCSWRYKYPDTAGQKFEVGYTPTYIALGFESGTADMYANGDDFDAMLLWNGYSYAGNFSGQHYNDTRTTNMWYSTVAGNFASNTAYQSSHTNTISSLFYNKLHDTTSTTLVSMGKLPAIASQLTYSLTDNTPNAPGGISNGKTTYGDDYFSTDGFSQKGFTFFKALSGTTSGTAGTNTGMIANGGASNWEKTANLITSCRVLAIPNFDEDSEYYAEQGKAIIVDEPEIFDEDPPGTNTYMMYFQGRPLTDAQMTNSDTALGAGDTDSLVTRSMDLKQTRRREGDMIFFDNNIEFMANNIYLPYLFISPKKYWLNIEMWPGDLLGYGAGDTDVYPATSDQSSSGTGFAWAMGATDSTKTYDGICVVSGNYDNFTFVSGSTFNEFNYSYNADNVATIGKAALYQNTWMLDVGPKTETDLDITKDYGYGAFNEESSEGGEVDIQTAYTNRPLALDFSKTISADIRPDEPLLATLQLNKPTANQSVTLYGNDYTRAVAIATGTDATVYDRQPHYLFGYFDELPVISDFTVRPTINVLEQDTNLYDLTNENLNSVTFEWDESGDDIWYRLLMVDNKPIENKYTNALLWIPFNDPPNGGSGYDPTFGLVDGKGASAITIYQPVASGTSSSAQLADPYALATPSYSRQRIEGIQGYGWYLTNTTGSAGTKLSGMPIAEALLSGADMQDEYTIMIHCRPAGTGSIFYKGNVTTGIQIHLQDSGKVTVSGQSVTMTGNSVNPMDGETPLAIMVTYKNDTVHSQNPMPMTLHINGQLEDYISTASGIRQFGSTDTAYVGMPDATNSNNTQFTGYIEELVVWNKRIYSPEMAGHFDFNTKEIPEYNSANASTAGASITYPHHAKLFVMDYHNIRGTSSDTLAFSSDVTWRTTIC